MGHEELKALIREVVKEVISEVNKPTKKRYTLDEAVVYLCENGYPVTKSKIYKLGNGIPRDRINGKLSFLREDLDHWIETQTTPANKMTEVAVSIARIARKRAKIA